MSRALPYFNPLDSRRARQQNKPKFLLFQAYQLVYYTTFLSFFFPNHSHFTFLFPFSLSFPLQTYFIFFVYLSFAPVKIKIKQYSTKEYFSFLYSNIFVCPINKSYFTLVPSSPQLHNDTSPQTYPPQLHLPAHDIPASSYTSNL